MHIWTIEKWVKHLDYDNNNYRTGLYLKFEVHLYGNFFKNIMYIRLQSDSSNAADWVQGFAQ